MVDDETLKEGAKAVQETAKAVVKVGEVSQDVGRFIGRALGTAPEDFVGLVFGDYLKEARKRNAARLAQQTEDILRERGVDPDGANPINPKHAAELFSAATEEGSEEVQDLWAALLANNMDPNRRTELRRIFIDVLKSMEPSDAIVFKKIGEQSSLQGGIQYVAKTIRRDTLLSLTRSQSRLNLSLSHLASLNCVKLMGRPDALQLVEITDLGIELYLACQRDDPRRT